MEQAYQVAKACMGHMVGRKTCRVLLKAFASNIYAIRSDFFTSK